MRGGIRGVISVLALQNPDTRTKKNFNYGHEKEVHKRGYKI